MQYFVFIIIPFSVLLNIAIFIYIFKKNDTNTENIIINDEIILNNTLLKKIIKDIESINEKIIDLEKKLDNDNDDLLNNYLKQGLNKNDIAKSMNKSVKEIDLIMKMRGLR